MMTKNRRIALGGASLLAFFTLIKISSSWGQSTPALKISQTGTNQVLLTVTNGLTNAVYQIYYTEFLSSNPDWVLVSANSTPGVTNFIFNLEDTVQGFFSAVNASNFIAPVITVLIQSPTNGAVIY